MTIHAKIGTMSMQVVRVPRLRAQPRVGQIFDIIEFVPGAKRQRVRCTRISDVLSYKLFFLELV